MGHTGLAKCRRNYSRPHWVQFGSTRCREACVIRGVPGQEGGSCRAVSQKQPRSVLYGCAEGRVHARRGWSRVRLARTLQWRGFCDCRGLLRDRRIVASPRDTRLVVPMKHVFATPSAFLANPVPCGFHHVSRTKRLLLRLAFSPWPLTGMRSLEPRLWPVSFCGLRGFPSGRACGAEERT